MTAFIRFQTLKEVTWENGVLHNGDLINVVKQLKQDGDSTILIFGSGTLVQPLTDAGLIDDYVLTVTPVVLGKGKALFKDVKKVSLTLESTQSFDSGNVLLHYKRA